MSSCVNVLNRSKVWHILLLICWLNFSIEKVSMKPSTHAVTLHTLKATTNSSLSLIRIMTISVISWSQFQSFVFYCGRRMLKISFSMFAFMQINFMLTNFTSINFSFSCKLYIKILIVTLQTLSTLIFIVLKWLCSCVIVRQSRMQQSRGTTRWQQHTKRLQNNFIYWMKKTCSDRWLTHTAILKYCSAVIEYKYLKFVPWVFNFHASFTFYYILFTQVHLSDSFFTN